jgi:phage terminase large subunit-like protein
MTMAPASSRTSVTDYARGVVAGAIIAGAYVRRACQRHLDDLRQAEDRGLVFDVGAATWAIDFFPRLCRHSKGEWAGQPLELEPWQKFVIGSIFGWKKLSDGTRRFRLAYVEIPRKNGKSTLAAGIGLLLAFFDNEAGAEVYSAATKRDQAIIVWLDAKRMAQHSPTIRQTVRILSLNLSDPSTDSKFEPLGADANNLDGLNAHGKIIDELHAHKTRAVWDVLETSSGSRRQPLTLAITTAGFDRHSICWEQHDYGVRLLEGILEDDSTFVYIATVDEGDDWRDPRAWAKANPNLDVSLKLDFLESECKKAQESPGKQNAFKRLHLNIWTEQSVRWLDIDVYDRNNSEPAPPAVLKQRQAYAGIDLSNTQDLTALELYFPDGEGGGDWLHWYFCPEDNIRKRADRDRVPYDRWRDEGYLIPTPGNVIDYGFIRQVLLDLVLEGYQIAEIGYDPWNAISLVLDLQEDGFTCVPVLQRYTTLSIPSKELERLLIAGRFRIGHNPINRWAASNVTIETDAAENIKPSKRKSTERIDPIMAMIFALDRQLRHENPGEPGLYVLGADEEEPI